MNRKTRVLNRRSNALDQQIRPENQEAFTDMICYLRGANISAYDQELVRQELTEMVLAAQERGEGLRSVIGQDYRAFCNSVIASLPPKSVKERIVDTLDTLCWCLSILCAIGIAFSKETAGLVGDLFAGRSLRQELPISAGGAITAGIILTAAVLVVELVVRNPFSSGEKGPSHLKVFVGGTAFFGFFCLIAWLGRGTLFTVNFFAACAVTLALYVSHRILNRL